MRALSPVTTLKWSGTVAIAVLVCAGCGKKAVSTHEHTTALQAQTSGAPAAPYPTATGPQPIVGTVDPQLTAALKKFVKDKGRLPNSLLELQGAELDSLPRAPTGHIFVIDPVTVQVKIVKR